MFEDLEKWQKNSKYIGQQYASWFITGRPKISWELAEYIYFLLEKYNILEVGITGSLCPSVFITLAYGNSNREVNSFSYIGQWDSIDNWNYIFEDSPCMELDMPFATFNIPFNEQINVWEGASKFFNNEAIFCDLPFTHEYVHLELKHFSSKSYKLIMLGFLQDYDGPTDVLEYFKKDKQYKLTKKEFYCDAIESKEKLKYELFVFERVK